MHSADISLSGSRRNRLAHVLIVIGACAWFAIGGSTPCRADETPTAAEALKAYRAYLNRISNITLTSEVRDRNAEESDVPTNGLAQSWKIDFPGKRMWRTTRSVLNATPLPAGFRETYSETLLTPDMCHEIAVDAETETAKAMTGYVKVPDDYWPAMAGFGCVTYPFGHMRDGRECLFVPDMLQDVIVTTDESGRVTLLSVTDEYRLSVRLDPAKGWMADWIDYTLLDTNPDRIRHESCSYEVAAASVHDGVWIPDAYQCRATMPAYEHSPKNLRLVDGGLVHVRDGVEVGEPYVIRKPRTTGVAEVTLANISLKPLGDADFQVQATVPDVLPVSMQDDRDSEFVWLEGKVIRLSTGPLPKRR